MSVKVSVEYDDSLNSLGWKMVDWLHEKGMPTNAYVFNHMKPMLKEIIEEWLVAHNFELEKTND